MSNQLQVGQTFDRVSQCIDAHPDIAQIVNPTIGRKQLEAAKAALRLATVEQGTVLRDIKGAAPTLAVLEGGLIRKYATPIAKFARGQLRGTPGFAALTPSMSDLHGKRLANAARQLVKAATGYAKQMEGAHFRPGFLQELANLADAVDAAVVTGADIRRRRANATKAVRDALKQGRDAVRTLDSIVSHLILGNAPLEAEWRAAKRVVQVAGVRKAAEQTPAAVTTPPAGTIITSTRPVAEAPAVSTVKAA